MIKMYPRTKLVISFIIAILLIIIFSLPFAIPVLAANDNFGNNGNGAGYAGGATGAIFFNQPGFTGTTSTGTGMSVLASNPDGSNAHNIQLGLYSMSGSNFTLVANTNSISIPAGASFPRPRAEQHRASAGRSRARGSAQSPSSGG